MSANNWAECPNCAKLYAERKQELDKLYGVISADEYREKLAAVERLQGDDETLREDWEIGTYHGEFYVSYGASCNKCGYEFGFSYSQQVPPVDNADNRT